MLGRQKVLFESGVKLFDLGVKLFGSVVNPALGQVNWNYFVVYTNEEKVDCRKENPMTAFVRVRKETQPNRTGVEDTPATFVGVAEMPSVQKLLMNTSEKETLEVVGSIMVSPFFIKTQPNRAG